MASAYPVAIIILITMAGMIIFPVLWFFLGRWQKKKGLNKLAIVSYCLFPTSPIVFLLLIYAREISAELALVSFILFSPVSLLLAIILMTCSVILVKAGTTVFKQS